MAGKCKPEQACKEAKYKYITSKSYNSYFPCNGECLFNQEYNTSNSAMCNFWNVDDYVEVEIFEKCNLWGHTSGGGWTPLIILKKTNDNFVDITNNYKKNDNQVSDWTKIIERLDKGLYRFKAKHIYNSFDEWFFEQVKDIKFLLEQNNQLYTMKTEFYDHAKSQYKPITEVDINNITDEDLKKYGFDDIGDILTETTAGDEKFKPIDKLKTINDGKFNILAKELKA